MIITKLESKMLINIAESEYTELNGEEPDSREQTVTYAFDVAYDKSTGGVLSSLIKKNLVNFDDFGDVDENLVSLSVQGFKAYKSLRN